MARKTMDGWVGWMGCCVWSGRGGAEEGGEERRGGLTFPGVRWLRKLSLYCRHALARTLALTLARPALWLIALVDQPELWLIHLSG